MDGDILAAHPFFTKWRDPDSGVDSYLLTERVAPFQRGLYFVTPSISEDGRWLWFSAAFPPSRTWFLAVASLDPARPTLRWFPQAPMAQGGPILTPAGDAVFMPIHDGVHRITADGGTTEIARLPPEWVGHRHLFAVSSNLTRSADGRHLVLDSHIGNRWLISLLELATGRVTPLRWFHHCHHHAQFSPVDPELILLGQGPWYDPITGNKGDIDIRMWLMDTKLTRYEPLFGDLWFNHNCRSCHEWWTRDGRVCWVDYDDGIYECRPSEHPRQRRLVWRRRLLCHGQCDGEARLFCADENPYEQPPEHPRRVVFFDRATGRETPIAAGLPSPPVPPDDRRSYHLDPHPHFAARDRFIVYTTTARGTVDVALTPVDALRARTGAEPMALG